MTKEIKITRTTTLTYKAKDQDLGYYEDEGLLNIDQIALDDVKQLEDGSFNMEDIEEGALEHEYEVVLVGEDGHETDPNPDNKERDTELFPKDDEDEAESDEHEVS